MHDTDQDCVISDGTEQVVGVDASGAVDRQKGNLRAMPLQEPAGRDDGRVLNLRRDDVRTFARAQSPFP